MGDSGSEIIELRPESVSHITARIKRAVDSQFTSVWVEGEVSNFKLSPAMGHAYFTLKDEKAQLQCAFFGYLKSKRNTELKDGTVVRVRGFVSVYEPRGAYQLIVKSLQCAGLGELMLRFEQLKRKLSEEGLFDVSIKRKIPRFPGKIGIVTSPTGAAIRDILNVIGRRFGKVHMIIAPARVQGEGAAEEIVRGIQDLNSLSPPPDVIIVGRGGGSIEDLWCFNEEIVARAVRASRVPVISAVGHEIDFTICDFASDLRAPTPSAAAELVVGRVEEISDSISGALARITRAMSGRIKLDSSKLESLASHRVFGEPEYILGRYRQNIDILLHKMCAGMNDAVSDCRLRMESMRLRMVRRMSSVTGGCISRISRYRDAMSRLSENRISALNSRVEMANARLNAMNPRAVLARGYAMVSDTDGNVIDSTLKLRTGMKVRTEVSDGAFVSVVLPTGVSGRRVRPGAVKDDPGVNEKTPRQQSLFGFCDKNPD